MSSVLHLIDTKGPGGAEAVFLDLVDRVRQRGVDGIAVIPAQGWLAEHMSAKEIPYRIVDMKGSLNWRLVMDLVRLVHQQRIQLIHAHLFGSNVYASLVGLLTGRPVVATFHGQVDVAGSGSLGWLKRLLLARGASVVVSVSQALQADLAVHGVIPTGRGMVVHNGVDVDNYLGTKSSRLRERLQLTPGTMLLGSLGNIRPAKGYDVLVRSMALLDKAGTDCHLVIAGQDKAGKAAELMRLAESLGVDRRITLLGFQQDTPEYLSNLDLFVLSSLSEGFSIATIEALAAGLPVVATRCGGPEEILDGRSAGYLADPGSPEALAAAIQTALGDRQHWDMERGRQVARRHFSTEAMIDRYIDIYKTLVPDIVAQQCGNLGKREGT